MSYTIHITAVAERDLMGALDYIEFTLKNPDAADNLFDAAGRQINSLADKHSSLCRRELQSIETGSI